MRPTGPFLVLVLLAGANGCGSRADAGQVEAGGDAPSSADAAPPDAGPPPSDATPPRLDAGPRDAGAAPDAPIPAATCTDASRVAAIGSCIDEGSAPNGCAAAHPGPPADPCDDDADGLDDGLEDALARSYAPAFAYNLGDGSHQHGDSEPIWPSSPAHYAAHAHLIWRVDGDSSTAQMLTVAPSLASLPTAVFDSGGTTHHASDPHLGEGPNFWLCLDQPGGSYPADALVTSMDASRTLPSGISLIAAVHPTGSDPGGSYAVIDFMLFYAYNRFTLDDHEGDWEGGAVFVDLESGRVVAIDTERHHTYDDEKLVPLTGPEAAPAIDPASDSPTYDVCGASDVPRGVRFWDFGGQRHHPVFYVSAGSHATYAYPGATKIRGIGCSELTIIRDVHNGENARLLPFLDAYAKDWVGTDLAPVDSGVHIVNVGEPTSPRPGARWTAFAGQWGCQLGTIAKSYPGPWDNYRLCRHWPTADWGTAPPFVPPTATSCP